MATKKKLTFEQQLAQVESLITQMEAGGMGLEESVKRYEEGLQLLSELEKELDNAVQRLTVLRKAVDGTETETPMEVQT